MVCALIIENWSWSAISLCKKMFWVSVPIHTISLLFQYICYQVVNWTRNRWKESILNFDFWVQRVMIRGEKTSFRAIASKKQSFRLNFSSLAYVKNKTEKPHTKNANHATLFSECFYGRNRLKLCMFGDEKSRLQFNWPWRWAIKCCECEFSAGGSDPPGLSPYPDTWVLGISSSVNISL